MPNHLPPSYTAPPATRDVTGATTSAPLTAPSGSAGAHAVAAVGHQPRQPANKFPWPADTFRFSLVAGYGPVPEDALWNGDAHFHAHLFRNGYSFVLSKHDPWPELRRMWRDVDAAMRMHRCLRSCAQLFRFVPPSVFAPRPSPPPPHTKPQVPAMYATMRDDSVEYSMAVDHIDPKWPRASRLCLFDAAHGVWCGHCHFSEYRRTHPPVASALIGCWSVEGWKTLRHPPFPNVSVCAVPAVDGGGLIVSGGFGPSEEANTRQGGKHCARVTRYYPRVPTPAPPDTGATSASFHHGSEADQDVCPIELPPLPAHDARERHDSLVVDGVLYLVGGNSAAREAGLNPFDRELVCLDLRAIDKERGGSTALPPAATLPAVSKELRREYARVLGCYVNALAAAPPPTAGGSADGAAAPGGGPRTGAVVQTTAKGGATATAASAAAPASSAGDFKTAAEAASSSALPLPSAAAASPWRVGPPLPWGVSAVASTRAGRLVITSGRDTALLDPRVMETRSALISESVSSVAAGHSSTTASALASAPVAPDPKESAGKKLAAAPQQRGVWYLPRLNEPHPRPAVFEADGDLYVIGGGVRCGSAERLARAPWSPAASPTDSAAANATAGTGYAAQWELLPDRVPGRLLRPPKAAAKTEPANPDAEDGADAYHDPSQLTAIIIGGED